MSDLTYAEMKAKSSRRLALARQQRQQQSTREAIARMVAANQPKDAA